MSFVRIILTYELVTTDVWRESPIDGTSIFDFNYVVAVFMGELYVVGLTTAIKLIIDWVGTQKKTLELERRNYETELSFLRSQLQPHFFFNTLNNLYSLTLAKSDMAPETVLKLSELMSYVIYQGQNKKVRLTEEVRHIQNYIDLESLRYGNKLNAHLSITGDIQDRHLPPLILMPFVENSFKHGIHYRNGKIPIQIAIQVTENALFFITKNLKSKPLANQEKLIASGIGVQNTKRRLELLYGKNFDLEIEDRSEHYFLKLKIKLDED